MAFVDSLVAQLLRCQVDLWEIQARLQAETDREALHDLRIQLRRLRSLLRPLRQHAGITPLYAAAAELGRLTTPWRDLEVLIAHLQSQGLRHASAVREATLQSAYARLRDGQVLAPLLALLDNTPATLRTAAEQGQLPGSKKRIRTYLHKQRKQLQVALADSQSDRHRLRLLTKRVRYSNEMYARWSIESAATMAALKAVQAALGDWHDLYQWGQRASREADLQPLQAYWQLRANQALAAVDVPLHHLARRLAKPH